MVAVQCIDLYSTTARLDVAVDGGIKSIGGNRNDIAVVGDVDCLPKIFFDLTSVEFLAEILPTFVDFVVAINLGMAAIVVVFECADDDGAAIP